MKWSILALTAVHMIGLTSIASAESAWVLWSKTVSYVGETEGIEEIGGRFWEVQNAFKDRQQCVKEATNYISMLETFNRKKEDAKVWKDEFAGRMRLHVYYRDPKSKQVFSAVCLSE